MSLAATAVVAPSRVLRALAALFGACNFAAALAVLFPADRFRLAPLCAAFFLLAAGFLLHSAARRNNTLRIDISGLGQLRLTVQQDLRDHGADGENAVPVVLLAGSTLWPQMMLLRLQTAAGAVVVLPVLRDSVTPQQFRALAVALAATAGASAVVAGTPAQAGPYHPIVGI
jgi:toxin CptA